MTPTDPLSPDEIAGITSSIFSVPGTGGSLPSDGRRAVMSVSDAYCISAAIDELRTDGGDVRRGRKIGFTNRQVWQEFEIMWGFMYESTIRSGDGPIGESTLAALSEPRIEPEIVFGIGAVPESGATGADLFGCIAWLACGFEIVQSPYADWKFSGPEAIAANGLHGVLVIGEPRSALSLDADALGDFTCDLLCDEVMVATGHSSNVAGGPLESLAHLLRLTAEDGNAPPLKAGDIITTGSMTSVPSIRPGQEWKMVLDGLDLASLTMKLSRSLVDRQERAGKG